MTAQVEHTDVGAYALGLLEPDDRRTFEEHLAGCASCAAELQQMSGMAELLTGLDEFTEAADDLAGAPGGDAAEQPSAEVIELMRLQRRIDRRHRRGTYLIGTVAAAALIGVGATVGANLADNSPVEGEHRHGPAQALVVSGERHSGSDTGTGASGLVGLETKGWGTHVGLELKGIRGPLRCHLEAVSRTGERTVVTGWSVPAKGYGVPGSPAPLITHGGTAIQRGDLDRFEVKIEGGGTLLTIPV